MADSNPDETWRETGFAPPNKIILSVARVVPQKNHRLTLEGFALFSKAHPEYRLLAIGGGNLIPDMEALAQELGVADKVRFMGYQKQIYPFFRIADFFVSTSLIEGFGTTHAEALIAGLPLVSTKTAGPDEMIEEGVNGYFIPEYTKKCVAESLEKMVGKDLTLMREAARETGDRFTLTKMVEKYEDLFEAAALNKK
jgi:glycosyltransferase involved in cell wall biosynthesis